MTEEAPVILVCDCSSMEHQLVIRKDEEYVYVHIHLAHRSFWKRLKLAVMYAFGYKCRYGNFDEVLLTPDHFKQFVDKTQIA